MKRLLFIPLMLLTLLSLSSPLLAQDGKAVRMFLNTGEVIDFPASEIDSITTTPTIQKVWHDGTYTSYNIIEIDSLWYMYPSLRITTKDMDFGRVAVGNRRTVNITIVNTGDYPETYTLLADGVFAAEGSGQEFTIDAGEAHDIPLTFTPYATRYYSGMFALCSSAIGEGMLHLPLTGRGVESESDEQSDIPAPVAQDFEVVLNEGETASDFAGFTVVNSYGEFPVPANAQSAPRRAPGIPGSSFHIPGQVSPAWMQANALVNGQGYPFFFSISLPGEETVFSIEKTAIDLLMMEPLLITSNEAEYRNTVETIKKLPSFDKYKNDIMQVYLNAEKVGLCPDYSQVNASPVILELMGTFKDNSDLSLDMVSLFNVQRSSASIKYRVQNELKRVVHIYPSRVIMDENNFSVKEKEEDTFTLGEFCEWVKSSSDLVATELDKEKNSEELEFIDTLKNFTSELEELLAERGLIDANSYIQLPIILDSESANYWKIVKGSLNGETQSIFHVESEEIETAMVSGEDEAHQKEFDKMMVDIYGFGYPYEGKHWSDFSATDKFRIIFALLHSAYKDVIKPEIQLLTGVADVVNAWGAEDNVRYDLRYGKRKHPEFFLVARLIQDFTDDPDNVKELRKNLENRDWWEIAKQITCFACDRVLSFSDENPDNKRTYFNLIYNIIKKWTGESVKSKEYRKAFKKLANKLTGLKKAFFVNKVTKVLEAGLDLAGFIQAAENSHLKTTFVVDKSQEPYIKIVWPKVEYHKKDVNILIQWETYKASHFGHFLYDLELLVVTPEGEKKVTAIPNIDGTSCEFNPKNFAVCNDAKKIQFRIVAHHPEYPEVIHVTSDLTPLISLMPADMPEFVDLGLPSGTLWANRNLGAAMSYDYGNYYAWGEVTGFNEGKTSFSWKNYRFCAGDSPNKLLKYCTKSHYGYNGFTDFRRQLQGQDDAASNIFGFDYSIPTKEEWEELMNECTWTWLNNCALVRGKNGSIIVLPMTGYRSGLGLYDGGVQGNYWSSTLDEDSPDDAWYVLVDKSKPRLYKYYRSQGRSIRPVYHPNMGTYVK